MQEKTSRAPRLRDRLNVILSDVQPTTPGIPQAGLSVACRTTDISVGGVRLSSEADLRQGTRMKLTLVFKNPPAHFAHRGIVRWAKPSAEAGRYLVGVQFEPLDEAATRSWEAFMQRRLAPASPDVLC